MEIKVSVVVPVYNAERFLRPCLDSIRNQTLKEIEIICVDDGSDDGSMAILKEYQEQDSRFVVLQKEHIANSGGGAARNMGIEKAVGKYLAVLDDDDFFELDMLETAYHRAEQVQAQVVIHNAYGWNYDNRTGRETKVRNTRFFPHAMVFSGTDVAEYLFQITGGAAWHCLFLRQFIMEKDVRFPNAEAYSVDDLPFNFLALSQAKRISVLNGAFVHHRLNIGTNQSKRIYIGPLYQAFQKLKEVLEKERLFEVYRCTFLNAAIPRLVNAVKSQQDKILFQQCYRLVKGEISQVLELESCFRQSIEQIYNLNAYYEYKMIMELSWEEYLLKKANQMMVIDCYEMPEEIGNYNVNVIIYGAGAYGRRIYGRILERGICQIVGWVDRNYEKLGCPVQKPDLIETMDYDYILIAIIDKQVVDEVKKMLINKGIYKKKILTLKNLYR